MKMMNSLSNKKTKKRNFVFLLGFFLLLASFTSFYQIIFDFFEKPFIHVWENEKKITNSNIFLIFSEKEKLKKENERLQKENQELSLHIAQITYKKSSPLERSKKTIPSIIISDNIIGSSHTFLINKGNKEGIQVGDKVISPQNLLLGFVSETFDYSSRIKLLSQSKNKISGILSPHNLRVTAEGRGKNSFYLKTSRDIPVLEGDVFYSSEPPHCIIARVRYVEFDPRDSFKKVFLSIPFDFQSIQEVYVLQREK